MFLLIIVLTFSTVIELLHFAEPPTEPRERILFHNALVNCCHVTLRQFDDALDRESASKKRRHVENTVEN